MIRDQFETIRGLNDFWESKFLNVQTSKEETDLYFETFNGLSLTADREYSCDHNELMLPYIPFFSSCYEFDSHIPFW